MEEMKTAKKKSYPENLLDALQVNKETRSLIRYDELTDDQAKGLEYVLSFLTERERIVFEHYFVEGISRKMIGERYNLPENRIKQIIEHAIRKLRLNKDWLFYIANGYEANCEYVQEQLEQEEKQYLSKCGVRDSSHLYYQELQMLGFPTRIYNALTKHGVKTVRDLIVLVVASERIRNFGEVSYQTICTALKEESFLPQSWEYSPYGNLNIPCIDLELKVFRTLNEYA